MNTTTHGSLRPNTRTSRPSGGGDGDSFPSTSIPCRMLALPCRQLRTTQVAHRFMQQCCHTCNACLATHALHVWHARPECLATSASHAVIARRLSAQNSLYLRKSSFGVRRTAALQEARQIDSPSGMRTRRHWWTAVVRSPSQTLNQHQRTVFGVTMRPDGHYSLVWAGSVRQKMVVERSA